MADFASVGPHVLAGGREDVDDHRATGLLDMADRLGEDRAQERGIGHGSERGDTHASRDVDEAHVWTGDLDPSR